MFKQITILILSLIVISGCKNNNSKTSSDNDISKTNEQTINIPQFNADSAYLFITEQLSFGPRVPGTEAHKKCSNFLYDKLQKYADTVLIQDFKARVYTGNIFDAKNIIASFNPDIKKRILLAAHWDSRHIADHDPDPTKRKNPIDGANDGASGVGILLEIARLMSIQKPTVGVDIILFDVEDYGPPEDVHTQDQGEEWGLGSQYWSKNPHIYNYQAFYGILLDMVGAENSKFYKEQFSAYYASNVLERIWTLAADMGYSDYFINKEGIYVNDDHLYVNRYANIPMIDIIHQNPNNPEKTFYDFWHTTKDDINGISVNTLDVVGSVVTKAIYIEK